MWSLAGLQAPFSSTCLYTACACTSRPHHHVWQPSTWDGTSVVAITAFVGLSEQPHIWLSGALLDRMLRGTPEACLPKNASNVSWLHLAALHLFCRKPSGHRPLGLHARCTCLHSHLLMSPRPNPRQGLTQSHLLPKLALVAALSLS